MKKVFATLVVVIFTLGLAASAYAFGPGTGPRGGFYGQNVRTAAFTPEQAQKFAQFQKDILPIKQKMLQLRTDLFGLRTQQNPDWKAIADKQKEMVDLRVEIQKKRAEAGLPFYGPGAGCRTGMKGAKGPRMGMGNF
ncbi:MAG: periplasmic heavy metal sensor [Dissulfurispiraceae bacterium]|jgi:Spy/CpxP family protein refolding chaperone|nr:periplasmic heavy metal sensor [Dissulfurispiraceae bacterium]